MQEAEKLLTESDSARLDAELLLSESLDKERSYLYTWPEKELTSDQLSGFQTLLEQRIQGRPIAYILGRQEFWSLPFSVNEHVLIPRPDTELLVESILSDFPQEELIMADLGTGSGAIALALASEKPEWKIIAADISEKALACARQNAQDLTISNVEFLQTNWCEGLPSYDFDLIVSNPPYIEEDDLHLKEGDVRFEPRLALVAADKGLEDIQSIAKQALSLLKSGGNLYLEHGYQQAKNVRSILAQFGYEEIQTYKDLSGHDRATRATKANSQD